MTEWVSPNNNESIKAKRIAYRHYHRRISSMYGSWLIKIEFCEIVRYSFRLIGFNAIFNVSLIEIGHAPRQRVRAAQTLNFFEEKKRKSSLNEL